MKTQCLVSSTEPCLAVCLGFVCSSPGSPGLSRGNKPGLAAVGFFFLQPSFQHAEVVADICISGFLCFQTPIAGEPFRGGICTT